MLQQAFLVSGHAEEVGFLGHLSKRQAARGINVVGRLGVRVAHKGLLSLVVPTFVGVEVDVGLAGVADAIRTKLPKPSTRLHVELVGGAHVAILLHAEALVEGLEGLRVAVADHNGLHAFFLCRLRDLLPMLIAARQEKHRSPVDAVVASEDVRAQALVGVPHVWVPIRVVDRRRDVELARFSNAWHRRHSIVHLFRRPQLVSRVGLGRDFRKVVRRGGLPRRFALRTGRRRLGFLLRPAFGLGT
eukprot:scaffold1741_cov262-Pinguiococcus_pyrenoidosus.AAC.46